jgi:hypothetical protein
VKTYLLNEAKKLAIVIRVIQIDQEVNCNQREYSIRKSCRLTSLHHRCKPSTSLCCCRDPAIWLAVAPDLVWLLMAVSDLIGPPLHPKPTFKQLLQ